MLKSSDFDRILAAIDSRGAPGDGFGNRRRKPMGKLYDSIDRLTAEKAACVIIDRSVL